MRAALFLIIVSLFSEIIFSQSYFYSFENTYSGWDTTGIDLELADTTIPWSIHPSDQLAADSSYSMQFYLANYNDAGKIWIQKPFNVEPQKDFIININYKFATMDFGMANLFTIITGVHLAPPKVVPDLIFQGHTGNGFDFDTGYVWLDKSYQFDISSDTSDSIWITVGIWGNWEAPRTYYFDSLSIIITEDTLSDVPGDDVATADYRLYQNYPNPFNPSTKIVYSIPQLSPVQIKVFDVLGNEVASLVDEYKTVGKYEVELSLSLLPSGVYFCQIKAGYFYDCKKMILVK